MIVKFATDIDADALARILRGLVNFQVDIAYNESAYCANPVEITEVDEDNDLVVCEVSDDPQIYAANRTHNTWAIPLDAIDTVTVL